MSDPSRLVFVPHTTLAAAPAILYTFLGTGNAKAYIRRIYAYNVTAGALTFSLYILPAGVGAVADQYAELKAFSLTTAQTPFERTYRDGEFILSAGDQIWAGASAATGVTLYIAGATQLT